MIDKKLQDKAWGNMETLLNSELPKRYNKFTIYRIAVAASIVLLSGFFLFNQFGINEHQEIRANELEVKPIERSNFERLYLNQINQAQTNNINQSFSQDLSSDNAKKPFIFSNKKSQSSILNEEVIAQNSIQPVSVNSMTNSFSSTGNQQSSIQEYSLTFTDSSQPKQDNKSTAGQSKQAIAKSTTKENSASLFSKQSNTSNEESKFVTNQEKQAIVFMTPELSKSFMPKIDMGLKANGSLGFVSKNFEDYGLRMGFELTKPVSHAVALNTGIRYSTYKDQYQETYEVDTPEELQDEYLVQSMSSRDVSRSFVEIPVYADVKVMDNFSLKGGASITYNKNNSEKPILSSSQIVNSAYLSPDTKAEAGKLYSDQEGYLGEFLVGATFDFDRIAFDVEATRGFINNQNIENRNVLGVRLSYRFGQ